MAHTTDEKIARENRLRLFRDDAARAKEEAAEVALAVRKNMSRLRELRLAKEAEAASAAQGDCTSKPARPARRLLRK